MWWVKAQTFPGESPKAGGVSSHPGDQLGREIQPPWGTLCSWAGVKSRYHRAGIPGMGIKAPVRLGAQDVPEQPRKLGSTGGCWSVGLRWHLGKPGGSGDFKPSLSSPNCWGDPGGS